MFGLILVGDELLSGKRADKHFPWLVATLNRRGLKLDWCRMVGDEDGRLTPVLREAFSGGDIVFCCGGIGATPDDRTRRCAAEALGLPLEPHEEATRLIEARYGADARPQRVKMAEFPQGSRLIPNPVNNVPGFSFNRVHFLPGFPNMAWPMIEWVLDMEYPALQGSPELELVLRVSGCGEGDLIPLLQSVTATHPTIRLSSLPDTSNRREIELGIRGTTGAARVAYEALRAELVHRGLPIGEEREIQYG